MKPKALFCLYRVQAGKTIELRDGWMADGDSERDKIGGIAMRFQNAKVEERDEGADDDQGIVRGRLHRQLHNEAG